MANADEIKRWECGGIRVALTTKNTKSTKVNNFVYDRGEDGNLSLRESVATVAISMPSNHTNIGIVTSACGPLAMALL